MNMETVAMTSHPHTQALSQPWKPGRASRKTGLMASHTNHALS